MSPIAWQAQSLALSYPDHELLGRLPLLREVATALPGPVGTPLHRFLDHAAATGHRELTAEYVATFDHHKRLSPYLTYFTYGDTRKRGLALLRFKHAYRAAGLELAADELPDHLAVVLEFAATEPSTGRRLLIEQRAALELLRLGLHDSASAWAGVLDSVSATLPPLAGRDRETVARLAAQGPPEESVGLDPYAIPAFGGGSR